MSWVKLDDGFLDHPKFLKVGPVAGYVAITAMAWSNRNLTDGFIPDAQVPRLANLEGICDEVRGPHNDYIDAYQLAQALVEAGLWDPAEGGYQIHDYHDHQQTAEAIKARRLKDRDRKASGRGEDSDRSPRGIQADSAVQEVRSRSTTPHSPPSVDCEEWLLHYEQTTGHKLPARTTKAFKATVDAYEARRAEGHTTEDLKLATVGAHADDYRRANGYDTADSILRPTKIAKLIAQGKLRVGGRNGAKSSVDLAREFQHGGAA